MVRFMIYADHSGCLLENRLQPERLEGRGEFRRKREGEC